MVDIQHVQKNNITKDLIEINKELKSFDNNLAEKKQYIIFNKIDLVSKENIEIIKTEIYKIYNEEEVFLTSTVNNEGIDELKKYILKKLNDLKSN